MNAEQIKAAKSVKSALSKAMKAKLSLRVYDGDVYLVPLDVELWGADKSVMEILEEEGFDVRPSGLHADGGAGV